MDAYALDKVAYLLPQEALAALCSLLGFQEVLGCAAAQGEQLQSGKDWLEDAGYLHVFGQESRVVESIAFMVHALAGGQEHLSLQTERDITRVIHHPLVCFVVNEEQRGRRRVMPLPGLADARAELEERLIEQLPLSLKACPAGGTEITVQAEDEQQLRDVLNSLFNGEGTTWKPSS